MVYKLMYIPSDDTQNYPVCRLQLVVQRLDTLMIQPIRIQEKISWASEKEDVNIKLWGLV